MSRFLAYSLSIYLMGCVVGWVVRVYVEGIEAREPAPEVVLPPFKVPAPWGACRVTSGPYPWVGDLGDVRDSVYVGLVCPDLIDQPTERS